MITLSHHDARYIALAGAYQHKDAIKALADYPDVQWHKESGAWLVENWRRCSAPGLHRRPSPFGWS